MNNPAWNAGLQTGMSINLDWGLNLNRFEGLIRAVHRVALVALHGFAGGFPFFLKYKPQARRKLEVSGW